MILWLLLALLTAACLAALLHPLLRGAKPAAAGRASHDIEVYRDQLAELERDCERGMISDRDATAARVEIQRRMLAADAENSEEKKGPTMAVTRSARRIAVALVVLVPAAALALYLWEGSPELPGAPYAERSAERERLLAEAPEGLDERMAELATLVEGQPDNLDAWRLLGRGYFTLGRYEDSAAAYRRAAALVPGDAAILSELGQSLVYAASGEVTGEARQVFAQVRTAEPGEPRARYYLGLAEAQAGQPEAALKIWIALERDSAEDAPWLPVLRQGIAQLAADTGADPATLGTRGPDRAQVEAAAEMSEDERAAMIGSMVEGLATRLEENPEDLDGWLMLARSRAAQGDRDAAVEAYRRAATLAPEDPEIAALYADALFQVAGQAEVPPPELLEAMTRLNALDPQHPTALWVLGAEAAARGDADTARDYWQPLIERIPPDTEAHRALRRQLDALGG
ncbi:MAG: c-type cytochrome biogenesis protein CcmI [Rhodospirillaceae bacterium]|nr:c-type cytochrome biogenesis protein CcmI [Rhodospirillaceae bacterium]